MVDLLELTREGERDFLRQHAKQAHRALRIARDDGLAPAAVVQLEEAIERTRDEAIARIRSRMLLAILAYQARVDGGACDEQ